MQCNDCRSMLSGFLDDELPASLGTQVQSHLDQCESCRNELEALASVGAGLRQAVPPLGTEFFDNLVGAARERNVLPAPKRLSRMLARSAATLLGAATFSLLAYSTLPDMANRKTESDPADGSARLDKASELNRLLGQLHAVTLPADEHIAHSKGEQLLRSLQSYDQ